MRCEAWVVTAHDAAAIAKNQHTPRKMNLTSQLPSAMLLTERATPGGAIRFRRVAETPSGQARETR